MRPSPDAKRAPRASIGIPPRLADAVAEDTSPARAQWLAGLPDVIPDVAFGWELELGDPYLPGGQCAWVAPVRAAAGDFVLKIAWRHREAEQEAEGLRHWDGDGAVRCFASADIGNTIALLLERCTPGRALADVAAEPEQDVIIAGLLRRLWARPPLPDHPFVTLEAICHEWADSFELAHTRRAAGLDAGIARAGLDVLRTLAGTATTQVLLCTDLHAENILAARREPWLMIDPKPCVGDPTFDPVQHMLNCEARLLADPIGLARRMAELADLDPHRVRLWLFARCVQESLNDHTMRDLARRLAP